MPSILDIGDLKRTIDIRGVPCAIRGLSGSAFLILLDQFPELRKLMGGGNREIDPGVLYKQAPAAFSVAIAYGLGGELSDGDEEHFAKIISKANTLTLGEQVEILQAIWEMTFPKGIENFVKALEGKLSPYAAPGKEADTKSPEPSKP